MCHQESTFCVYGQQLSQITTPCGGTQFLTFPLSSVLSQTLARTMPSEHLLVAITKTDILKNLEVWNERKHITQHQIRKEGYHSADCKHGLEYNPAESTTMFAPQEFSPAFSGSWIETTLRARCGHDVYHHKVAAAPGEKWKWVVDDGGDGAVGRVAVGKIMLWELVEGPVCAGCE